MKGRGSCQCSVMAPCKKYLWDLTEKSRHFTMKVKIIEKTQPQGGQMGVTIYSDDIASYAEAIKCKKESYENVDHLKSLREAVEGVKVSVKKAVLRSISDFQAMKGNNTTNGQCIWICGCIENLDRKMICLYLGYDACGSKTYEDIGTKYKYSKSSCTSWTSTSVASKVLGIEADKLYRMKYEMVLILLVNMNGGH
ncbi:hypothetical protein Cgig2_013797 [Carnegiea gigantea]|uniref:Uncharacterized protein n=1 Tax=Carnegiea gigantea TaxID=171969 RepID=A0A9Q1JGS8_9CARY|nr:hypothetical protein Cgig2_013797 [Carnegiea gigantea]